jgi:hypothetical protein
MSGDFFAGWIAGVVTETAAIAVAVYVVIRIMRAALRGKL